MLNIYLYIHTSYKEVGNNIATLFNDINRRFVLCDYNICRSIMQIELNAFKYSTLYEKLDDSIVAFC